MRRLALLHTVPLLIEPFKALVKERYPTLDSFHMLDESLLQDLLRGGRPEDIVGRVGAHARLAEAAGAGLIVFTCSSTSPAVDVARRQVGIPILKIDDPMAEEAVRLGPRIGVVCTASSTEGPSTDLIRHHAARLERTVAVRSVLEKDAYAALAAGDRATHDRLVGEAAAGLAAESDVVVLAQASMAHLAPGLRRRVAVPVLASPELCVAALAGWVAG